jgi:predicted  nucleic acid-binding Zn-ribbon protein
VDQVAEDLKSLNLGQARDDWQTVQDDAAELSAAVQELASDRRDEIQPQVDELRSTVSSVTDATSLEELGSTLDTAEQQLSQIVTTITTSLDCPTS